MRWMLQDSAKALCHRWRWHRTLVLSMVVLNITIMSAQTPAFTNVAKGDVSGLQETKQVTIRTAAEWAALWKDHSPNGKMPVVDFAKQMVVGIFLGTKPSTGHEVEIVGVRTEGKDLIVEYVQKQPGRGTMAAQILTEPFHLVSVAQHAGTVRFIHVPAVSR